MAVERRRFVGVMYNPRGGKASFQPRFAEVSKLRRRKLPLGGLLSNAGNPPRKAMPKSQRSDDDGYYGKIR